MKEKEDTIENCAQSFLTRMRELEQKITYP